MDVRGDRGVPGFDSELRSQLLKPGLPRPAEPGLAMTEGGT